MVVDEGNNRVVVGKVADVLDARGEGGEEGEDEGGGEGGSSEEVVEEAKGDGCSTPRTRGEGSAATDASDITICH